MDLYSEIMNIQICDKEVEELFTQEAYAGYKLGKREMRSDAAELALKADARIEELEMSNKVNAEDCNEAEKILRDIIKEWSCSGDLISVINKAKEFLE